MDKIKILSRIYIAVSVLFVFLLFFHPYPGSWLIKAVPCTIMAYLSFSYLKSSMRILMILGFLFSGLGDIFLDLSRENFFIQGLASFALAQLLFAIAFTRDLNTDKKRLLFAGIILLFTATMVVFLIPSLGKHLVPVIVYIVLISAMGVSAAFLNRPLSTVYAGAFFFIISDSMIAINKFLSPFPYSTFFIISFYFLAQYKIGTGIIKSE
ncbi:MAG: lysoplasmalogenase [Desulfobacterales bacterium]|jgi:uncharacterized membrane protein YhhN|nr:lysoplasmalogenase [Desulfobacterales bacterium]MBT7697577.1 lysoplasmalogenase [Desulfobacterales bacterium]